MKRILTTAVLAALMPAGIQAAPLSNEQGMAAYDAALKSYSCVDYDKAYKLFKDNADKGHALSQYMTGVMLSAGQGAGEDDQAAFEWFAKAAGQNLADAQFALGDMYHKGEGVARDDAQALFWFKLAIEGGHGLARDMADAIAATLPAGQVAEVKKRFSDWNAKRGH